MSQRQALNHRRKRKLTLTVMMKKLTETKEEGLMVPQRLKGWAKFSRPTLSKHSVHRKPSLQRPRDRYRQRQN